MLRNLGGKGRCCPRESAHRPSCEKYLFEPAFTLRRPSQEVYFCRVKNCITMSDISHRTQEELEDEVARLCIISEVLAGRLMLILAELDRRGDYAKHGHSTLADWLAWRTGKLLGTAREHVRVAR